uniref:Uncharacterized protein n=1 Tax=Cucumis melo TaxID=3656 RepID=A0A9I9E2A6_CUCME
RRVGSGGERSDGGRSVRQGFGLCGLRRRKLRTGSGGGCSGPRQLGYGRRAAGVW